MPTYACCLLMATVVSHAESFSTLEARLAQHPSLVALEYEAQAERERSTLANALPDPMISLGINNFPYADPSFTTYLPTNKAIGIRQDFPARAAREAKAAESDARATRTVVLQQAQLAQLKAMLIGLLSDQQRIRTQMTLVRQRKSKYDELTQVAESEIDAGQPVVYRLAEIEGERTAAIREEVRLEQEQAVLQARLINLVGTAAPTDPPTMRAHNWTGQVRDFHRVRIAEANLNVATQQVAGADAAWDTNWSASLTYQQREAGSNFDGEDWISAMVSFSVPLWSGSRQEPQLRAAIAGEADARQRYEAAVREAVADYQSETANWQAAEKNIAALKSNIAAVKDEIAAQLTIYESGVGDYARIIDGEISILKLESLIAGEQAARAAAIARLNALLVLP